MSGMRDVFCDTICAIDPSVSADQASAFFDSLLAGDVLAEDQQLGSTKILFVPEAAQQRRVPRSYRGYAQYAQ